MRTRYKGSEAARRIRKAKIVRNGVYNTRLNHTNIIGRLLLGANILAIVTVAEKDHVIPYRSIEAFDRDWEIINPR